MLSRFSPRYASNTAFFRAQKKFFDHFFTHRQSRERSSFSFIFSTDESTLSSDLCGRQTAVRAWSFVTQNGHRAEVSANYQFHNLSANIQQFSFIFIGDDLWPLRCGCRLIFAIFLKNPISFWLFLDVNVRLISDLRLFNLMMLLSFDRARTRWRWIV